MWKNIKLFIDVIGLGFWGIISATFCIVLFGFSFGFETKGLDNPYLFVMVLVLTVWGFYSLWQLPKHINKLKAKG